MEPIRDYLLIGDLHTAALVSARGSIDWLCFPTFDGPSVCARILDERRGGRFAVDDWGWETASAYEPDTAIVETRFSRAEEAFLVRDCFLPRPIEEVVPHYLVRSVTGERGTSEVTFLFDPRPRYARQQRVFIHKRSRLLSVRLGERSLWLHLPRGARVERRRGGGVWIGLSVEEGETKELALEYSLDARLHLRRRNLLEETRAFWRDWVAEGRYRGPHRDRQVRSAITLKLMQFYPTGGLIAAPTTSLPEELGGERNWDYRYVWMRDATFTLSAFRLVGHRAEAEKFFGFVERIVEEAKEEEEESGSRFELNLMYTIWGQIVQGEQELEHLSGYRGSRPVRIGNGAAAQHQLDLYGSIIDAYAAAHGAGMEMTPEGRDVVRFLAARIIDRWREADSGIWEVRDDVRHFTYSKVMCWVGLDRALGLADVLALTPEERAAWGETRDTIAAWVWEHCYDAERGTFRQHPDTDAQDATNFLFVLLGFVDPDDARARSIVERTAEELGTGELFIHRYKSGDGLRGEEGAFLLCSAWYIAALAAIGERERARNLFDRFCALMPDSGLLAEEIDPRTGEFLGNFPQAFSHIGLLLIVEALQEGEAK